MNDIALFSLQVAEYCEILRVYFIHVIPIITSAFWV